MRLKEDTSNYRASNVLRKVKELPEEPRLHKKKNTHRWCKGKVGVEHVYVLVESYKSRWFSFKVYKCENCGKKDHR